MYNKGYHNSFCFVCALKMVETVSFSMVTRRARWQSLIKLPITTSIISLWICSSAVIFRKSTPGFGCVFLNHTKSSHRATMLNSKVTLSIAGNMVSYFLSSNQTWLLYINTLMLQSMAIKISNHFQQLQKIVRFSINNSNLKTQKYVKSVRTQTLILK